MRITEQYAALEYQILESRKKLFPTGDRESKKDLNIEQERRELIEAFINVVDKETDSGIDHAPGHDRGHDMDI